MTTRSLIRAAAVCGTAAIALSAAVVPAGAHNGPHNSPGRSGEIARVAAATAKYHNIANAIRDGYVPTNTCAELPGTGGMGYHYANPRLSSDNRLDPLHPRSWSTHPARTAAANWPRWSTSRPTKTRNCPPTRTGRPCSA